MTRRARPGRVGVSALLAMTATMTCSPGPRAAALGLPQLSLASQTPWVGPGQEFGLRINVGREVPAGGVLTISIYNSVASRSEFAQTEANRIIEPLVARPLSIPLNAFTPDPAGAVVVRIPVQDPSQPRDRARLQLSRSGVYPVRVELKGDGAGPLALVTHLVYQAAPIVGPKLNVTWIVPIHALTRTGPGEISQIADADSARLGVLAGALDARRDVPVVVRPTPDTLAALSTSARPQDRTTVDVLHHPNARWQFVTGTYVPVSLAAMLTAGLRDVVSAELTKGSDTTAATLDLRPDGRTWVASGPLDSEAATFLKDAQVDHIVVPETDLSANPLPVTFTRPFDLAVRPGTHLRAASSDPDLGAHFMPGADPVLSAHQLLADLAVVYLDRPGQTRGVIIDTPLGWQADARFLSAFLDGLTSSPIATPVTLDQLFTSVPVESTRRGEPLLRTLVGDPAISRDAAGLPAEAIRLASRRVDAFGTALTIDNPLTDRIERAILKTASVDLEGSRAKQAQIDAANRLIDEQLGLFQLPTSRTITLTANGGRLPITILSQADYRVHVLLKVSSEKLSFPAQRSTGSLSEAVDLQRGTNRIDLEVRARTAGSFPLHISVSSPDGRLLISSTTFTVRSTALSGVGLVLSIGAALFLAGWWGGHARRSRKVRRAGQS